jgi:hypothetical protein
MSFCDVTSKFQMKRLRWWARAKRGAREARALVARAFAGFNIFLCTKFLFFIN